MNLIFVLVVIFPLIFTDGLPQMGQPAPQINFQLMDAKDNKMYKWEDFNNRVVVLDFWATWCTPCIKEFPKFNRFVKEYPDSLVTFVSITYEPRYMLEPFFKKFELNSLIAIDNDFATFKSFAAWGIPMVAIINKSGKIAAVTHPEYLTKQIIDEVLAEKIPKVKPAKAWSDPAGAEEYFRSLVKPKSN